MPLWIIFCAPFLRVRSDHLLLSKPRTMTEPEVGKLNCPGSSALLVGVCWHEIELSTEEEDSGAVVVKVLE